MTDKTKAPLAEMFDQAMKNYDQALKTGLKMQDELTKWWSSVYSQPPWSPEWQQKMATAAEEAIPVAQKNLEDTLKLIEQNSRTSMDLLRQAMEAGQGISNADGQARWQRLWQTSLGALQSNAQALTSANARWMTTWTALVQRAMEPAATGKSK